MSGGQIVALIFAILLLLPGGCFLILLADPPVRATSEDYQVILPIVAAILGLAGLLFWVAFRRRSPAPGEVPQTPSDPEAGGGVS
jgi:hypothetical protein